ncbi:MAG TPA: hypothetical protein VGO63_02235, partial [Candidatus Paceibacterota bacterium]|nr:hypothetical protein [Candidatus Paceibacterota bacterium]
NVAFNQTSPTVSIGNTGSLVFNDGTNTLCTIADAGTTGNLTCTGNITDSGLTATRVTFSGTAGLLSDDAGFIFTAASDQLTLGENGQDGSLKIFAEDGGTDHSTIFNPGTQTQDITYTLPVDDGGASQFLKTNGSGVLSWTAALTVGDTIASATTGSVFFAGTSGVLAQDNTNFFWDDTNNRLGIGVNAPTAGLDINSGSTTPLISRTSGATSAIFNSSNTGFNGFRVAIDAADGVPYVALDTGASQKAFVAYWGDSSGYASLGYGGSTNALSWKTSGGTAGYVGIGTTAPDRALEVNSATGINLRLTYNDSNGSAANYADLLVGSSGDLTITASGSDTLITSNFVVGSGTSSTETLSNTGYVYNGDDLFVAGQAGVEGSIFTDTSLIVGASTTYGNGSISQSSGETLTIGTTAAALTLQTTTSGNIVLNAGGSGTTELQDATNVTGLLTANGGISLGTQAITGTTGIIDYTNFDVNSAGNITVAAAEGLDTNGAGALELGKANATSIDFCNSATCDTISIGNLATTDADAITIGDVLDTTAINSTGWSMTGAGTLAVVSINSNTATTLNIANATATGLSLCNSATCDTITIGNNADADTVTIGDALDTTAINSTGWNVTGAGAMTVASLTTGSFAPASSAVVNFGGGVNAAELRFLEPSGSGVNFSAFKAGIQGADITYTLPTAVATSGFQLTDVAGNGTLSWQSQSSTRNTKNIDSVITNPDDYLNKVLDVPIYNFHYKTGMGTGDSDTQYVGIVADEAPWAMHYNGQILNPVNTFGYSVLSIQALNQRMLANLGTLSETIHLTDTNLENLSTDSTQNLNLTMAQIGALGENISDLENTLAGLTSDFTSLGGRIVTLENLLAENAFDNLNSVATQVLTVNGDSAFTGRAQFDGLSFFNADVTFGQSVRFDNTVEFTLPPLFNKDTAGFAIVKEGDRRVRIDFDREYVAEPVVTSSITFETDDEVDDDAAALFFDSGVQSVIIEKDTTGFTILLSKSAPRDIRFSWTAFAVRDPKIIESVYEGLTLDVEPDASPTPEPLPEPDTDEPPAETLVPSLEPTPGPIVTPEPVPEPEAEPLPANDSAPPSSPEAAPTQ